MKHAACTAVVGSLLFSIGTACSSSGPAGSSTGGSSSTDGGLTACPTFTNPSAAHVTQHDANSDDINITAAAANNYSFTSTMHLSNQSVAEKSTLTFDWSTLTKDMYGRTIDPKATIGGIVISIWNYTKEVLETTINSDKLVTGDRKGAAMYFTQNKVTQVTTAELTSDGSSLIAPAILDTYFSAENFPSSAYTFLVMVQGDGTTPAKDGRMLTTFGLSTDTTASKTVTIDNSSTTLDYQADFSKLSPTRVPAGTDKIFVDWSQMTTNALGNSFDGIKITKVLIAAYDLPISELQKDENFIELEKLATGGMWVSNSDDIQGKFLSLSEHSLKDSNGNAFAGIDSNHTWILALECGECLNPAPWYITVLEPCTK